MTSHVLTETVQGVAHITLNRPEKKNALTDEMYLALIRAVDQAAADPHTRVLLFSGAQGVFTAGNDLDDFLSRPPKDADAPVFTLLRRLVHLDKPVVAAVQGLAIGIGTTLLLHCDLVYASQAAKFALPFVNLGLVPEAASSLLLAQGAGHQRAAEKLLLGDPFDATEAMALGFVTRLLPHEEVVAFAVQQAQRLAALPAGSVTGTKQLMRTPERRQQLQAHMAREIALFSQRLSGPALQEAVAAFKAKRKPDFNGLD